MDEVLSPDTMKEIEALLEAEPSSGQEAAPGPDIPALREQLAVLVSSGKAKEAIGVQLTHEHVKRMIDKDVEKYRGLKGLSLKGLKGLSRAQRQQKV